MKYLEVIVNNRLSATVSTIAERFKAQDSRRARRHDTRAGPTNRRRTPPGVSR
jgi:hypothetical protein